MRMDDTTGCLFIRNHNHKRDFEFDLASCPHCDKGMFYNVDRNKLLKTIKGEINEGWKLGSYLPLGITTIEMPPQRKKV